MDSADDSPESFSVAADVQNEIRLPKSIELPTEEQSQQEIFAAIKKAAANRKMVYITYRHPAPSGLRIHHIEPYSYSYRTGKHGLMAWDQVGKGVRNFSVEDIINAVPSNTKFKPRWQVEIGDFRESSRLVLIVAGGVLLWLAIAWFADHASPEDREKWIDWVSGILIGGALLYYLSRAVVRHPRAFLKYVILAGTGVVTGLSLSWYIGALFFLISLYVDRFLWKAFVSWVSERFPPRPIS